MADFDASYFAGRLREMRLQAGLTQKELGENAGLTREGVAQLETRRREPAWATVVAICNALGVSCEEFLKQPDATKPKRGRPPKAKEERGKKPTKKPRRK